VQCDCQSKGYQQIQQPRATSGASSQLIIQFAHSQTLVTSFQQYQVWPERSQPCMDGRIAIISLGLWKDSLLDDLLWAHWPIEIGNKAKSGGPKAYRAPSCSWAAVEGNVRWPLTMRSQSSFCYTSLVETRMDYVGSDPYGQVSGGLITVCGLLRRLENLDLSHSGRKVTLPAAYYESGVWSNEEQKICYSDPRKTYETAEEWSVRMDMSCEDGISELEYQSRNKNKVEVWLLCICIDGMLVLTRDDRGPDADRMFRRVGLLYADHLPTRHGRLCGFPDGNYYNRVACFYCFRECFILGSSAEMHLPSMWPCLPRKFLEAEMFLLVRIFLTYLIRTSTDFIFLKVRFVDG
jgi:hypothetical protein